MMRKIAPQLNRSASAVLLLTLVIYKKFTRSGQDEHFYRVPVKVNTGISKRPGRYVASSLMIVLIHLTSFIKIKDKLHNLSLFMGTI